MLRAGPRSQRALRVQADTGQAGSAHAAGKPRVPAWSLPSTVGEQPLLKRARVLWNDASGELKSMRYARRNAFLVKSLQDPLLDGLCLAGKLDILCVKGKRRIYYKAYDEHSVTDRADIRVRR
mmetsp:Transcript_4572/g.13374  ORF Transcript_4572/g.13374 Transcript_4572/m.13374 type:complete len:123 (-) Transcript_4572:212-580(-)